MAYTYTGTPNQRLQQAQRRIQNDESVELNPTLSAYMQAAEQAKQQQEEVIQNSEANFGVRLGDTLGDVAKNTLDGMLKAGEGLLDFGASTIGVIAGWFGNNDLKQRAAEWSARDLVGEMWESGRQNGLNVDFENSYINDLSETGQNIVRGVAQGVGQMLPMVAVTLATGGAGGAAAAAGKISAGTAKALNTAGKAINLVGLGMSAAGTSTERALNTDIVDENGNTVRPSLDRAYLFGLASGAVEMATEKLVGGVFEKFTGTGLADKVINKLSKSVKFGKAVQFGLNVVGEGVEEMVSEAVGKTLETIYNSPDGKMHWESPDMQDVIVSGIVGSLTAAVMGGADVGVRKISNVATAQDAMLDYENTQKKADNLARQGKLTAEDVVKFDADNAKTLDTISRRYQRASENGRAKMKASIPGIMELLNEDGSVKKTALIDGATEITADSAVQAMSGSLAVSRRTEIANALKEQNLSLAQNLDSTQKTNMSKLEQVLKLVGKKTGQTTKVVVAEYMPLDNAHTDGDIMYISKDRLSNVETMAQDVAHEAFHFAEGTDEYRKMVDFFGTIKLNGESLVDTAIEKVRNLGYEVDDKIFDTIKNGESVSGENVSQVRLAFSEINAKMAELLLGDAETINKLIERDRSLARKVLSNIRDYANIIEMTFKGDAEGIETLKQMRKAIKLYEDALAASGAAYYRPNTTNQKTEQKETEAVKARQSSKKSIEDVKNAAQNEILSKKQTAALRDRGVSGDDFLNAEDLAKEILSVGGTITEDGKAVLYHGTTAEAAAKIKESGKMVGKEPNLFFSTKKDGLILDYGKSVVEVQIPLEKLELNDIFDDELHLTMETQPNRPTNIRFSLRESIEDDVIKKYGKTYRWAETGYLLKDGSRVDMSGRNEGAPGGYRTVDHRDIFYDIDGSYGTDAMIEFMQRGNIRVMPEQPGINLQIEPTEAQYRQIQNLVETLGWKNKEFSVDFDNASGDTIDNLYYEGNVSARKVISDIQYYFKEGKTPYQSELSKFRYSLRENATDSEGRKLSKKQLEFFKDSKVVDENGNLLVVYHGTPNGNFFTFEYDKSRQTGTDYGKAFYFTTNLKNAKGYAKDNHKDPRIKEYELKRESLKKQILTETDTTKRQELEKQFRNVKVDGKSILEILYDVDYDTGGEIRQVYLNLVNPLIADAQKKYHYEVYPELFKQAIKNGNDGIIVRNVDDSSKYGVGVSDVYIAFSPEQIKLTTNETPTANPDIRYSLREKPLFNDKKTKAELIKRIEGMQLDFYGKYFAANTDANKFFAGDAQGDRLASQIVLMANDSNESNRYAYAEDLAEAIINNMVVTDVDPQLLSEKTGLADAVRQYMHKLNLTEDVMKELKYHYGEKEARVIRMLWGAPNDASTKMSIDDAAIELQSAGYVFGSDNVSDQFIEMLDIVEQARKDAHRELSKTAKQLLSEEEYTALKEEIRDDVLSFMEEKGTQEQWEKYYKGVEREAERLLADAKQKAADIKKLAALEEQLRAEKQQNEYTKKVKELEQELQEATTRIELRAADDIEYNKEYHRLVDKVWSEAVSLSADNLKKYNNASDLMNKEFASVVKKLAGIKYRGELKKGATRRIIADFGKWYNVNNPLLTGGLDAQTIETMMNDANVENIGYLDKFTLNAIETISENQTREVKAGKKKGQSVENNKPLSADELRLVGAVLGSARHVLKNYNTVEVNKKKIVLSAAAIKANKQAQAIAPHIKKRTRIGENVSNSIKSIIDPTALIGEMFGYQDNNPLVDSFKDIQEGATHAQYLTNSFTDIIDDFTKSHKSYKKHLADKIKVGGHEIRVDVALSLYMLSQQADSINGLKNGGWGYVDEKGYWIDCGKLTDSDISSLYDDFTKADKDFLNVARKFFDTTGKAMAETDVQYRGYTLINADAKSDYFPITRYSGDMSKPIADAEATRSAMQVSVANYSFTKERVKNERRITVSPILSVISKHAREVGNYCGLAIPIKEFQRIYNCNIGENGATKSIRNTINEQSWSGFNSYITTLLEDIQGISREKNSLANKALNLIRSNIATFALGFNIKTILSQISGYPAISMYVSLDSMAKAMAHSTWYKGTNAQNMLAYSEWAAVKAHDNGLILAETASEKLGKVANMTTIGIQMMDNWMNRLIWNACQCEVEKRTGLKFGTKENMVEAGKLHAEVGRMTQGNNARSELSAMQRSSNALAKMYSMFNSDGFKYISRLYEAAKRASAYKYLNKTNPGTISQQKVRSAHVFMAKAATAIIVSNLVYVLMGQLMKFALNKDREDEEGNEISFWQDLGMDFASSMVGMIPIVRDIYSLVVEGYDVKDNATEGIMNLAESIKDVIESSMTMIKGDVWDSTDIAKPLKSLIDAIGQVTGIPTRNVYNYVYGLTKRFSPSTAYEWNSLFYNNGYTKDLKKAIEKDDVDLQKTIIGLMLKDDGMTDTSAKVNERLRELYKQGYTVLPRTVKDSLAYNGEVYELSKRQQNAFKAIYGQANKDVEELVASRQFSALSSEIQARAIKWIYDYYYESAVYDAVGEEADSKKQLFGEVMSTSKFAMTIAYCRSVESKLDKKGNVIAGSRKAEILRILKQLRLTNNEILMVLAYLGYSVEGNEMVIKSFVSRIGLSKSQQRAILSYCGIAA